MVKRTIIALACLLGLLALGYGAPARAQTMDGCYITGFDPGTMIPEYDCSYQKSAPHPPVFAGTWYASIAKSASTLAWGAASSGMDQSGAISDATNACRKYGGKNCAVVVTPCGRESVTSPPCLQTYTNDISKGSVWASMTPEQKALWNKKGNGACK